MVESVKSTSGVGSDLYVATPVRTAQAAAPVAVAKPDEPRAAASQLAQLAKAVASEAPVDTDRVAQIRQAIQNGTFPILPATIADQMLAFRYEWMSHDAS